MKSDPQRYTPSSRVLFVSTCSFNKQQGGEWEYSSSTAIASALSKRLPAELLWRRNDIMKALRKREIQWQGKFLNEHVYNTALQQGPEFGGTAEAQYLPAIDRYNGRFYNSLLSRGRDAVLASEHHMLILSGLYGLVRPMEPIQLYSCKVDRAVSDRWRKDELLTRVLEDYCKTYSIQRIFDLTGMADYRNMIDWERVGRELPVEGGRTPVLRCCWAGAEGQAALGEFGAVMSDYFLNASEADLLEIEPKPDGYHDLGKHHMVFIPPGEVRSDLPKEEDDKSADSTDDAGAEAAEGDPSSHDRKAREVVLTASFLECLLDEKIVDSKSDGLSKQILKCLCHLGQNLRHSGLNTHEYDMKNPYQPGEKVFEAYVQNSTPEAHRVIWCYGRSRSEQIVALKIIPHPKKAARAK